MILLEGELRALAWVPMAPCAHPLVRVITSCWNGLPRGSDSKRICLQCGRPGFDPWVGKIPWRRAWLPTPVFLPGEYLWTDEPGRPQSRGSQRIGHDWATKHSTAHKLLSPPLQVLSTPDTKEIRVPYVFAELIRKLKGWLCINQIPPQSSGLLAISQDTTLAFITENQRGHMKWVRHIANDFLPFSLCITSANLGSKQYHPHPGCSVMSHTPFKVCLLSRRKQRHQQHFLWVLPVTAPGRVSRRPSNPQPKGSSKAAQGEQQGTARGGWQRPRLPLWTKSQRSRWGHFVSFLFKENQEQNKKEVLDTNAKWNRADVGSIKLGLSGDEEMK